ncbi:MAG: leucine-rich repeat domain-containing protein [Treponemataceae bacterium]|nr:leucine-rich repeat domain-containing protein [Treponemataceae bacterium]
MKKNFFNFLLCSALFLVLTALVSCGGGGGGSASLFMPENDLRNGGTGGWGGSGNRTNSSGAPASNLVLTGGTALNVDHYVYNGQSYNTAQELLQVLTAQASADGTYQVEVWVSGETSARPGRYVVSGDRRTLQHPYKITINNSDAAPPFYSTDDGGTYFYASEGFPLSNLGDTVNTKPINGQSVDFPYTYTINGQTVLATGSLSGFSGDIEYTATKEQAKYVVTADKKLAVDISQYDAGEDIEIPANAGAFCGIVNSASNDFSNYTLDLSNANLIKSDGSSLTALDYEAYQNFKLNENAGTAINITFPAMQTGSFSGCSETSITIPEGITGIGEYSFSYLNNLTSITWSSTLRTIEQYAFFNCDSLTSITIPDSVRTIGTDAFGNCDLLASVTLNKSLEEIGPNAFIYCLTNMSISIPCTFENPGQLARLPSDATLTITAEDSSNDYIAMQKFKNCSLPQYLVIDNSISSVSMGAFEGCTTLVNVTIPNGVEVYNEAFQNCTSLTTLNLPGDLTEIDQRLCCGCINLTTINIPNTVTEIHRQALSGCTSLGGVTIPSGVNIRAWAFENCPAATFIFAGEPNLEVTYIDYDCANQAFDDGALGYFGSTPVSWSRSSCSWE